MSKNQTPRETPDIPKKEAMGESVFVVVAHWDDEAEVFYSESNIIGLHIEAGTIEEFEDIVQSLAPELCYLNHLSKRKESVFKRLFNFAGHLLRGNLHSQYPPVIVMKEHGSVPVHAE